MKKFIFILLLPLTIITGQDPVGHWTITDAVTLRGFEYTGELDIIKQGDAYRLDWTTTAGDYPGIGLLRDDILAVGWGDSYSGVTVYEIENGYLKGEWTAFFAEGMPGTEKSMDKTTRFEGIYDVTGTNPDGSEYTAELTIEKTGETYLIKWVLGGETGYGIGIKIGDLLCVGFGRESYGVIAYKLSGDTAEGIWTIQNAENVTTENIKR